MNQITIILGPEYDENTRYVLRSVLVERGAVFGDAKWGLGGSQEIETAIVNLDGSEIVVEAETYIGLTITGNEELVASVAKDVAERLIT